MYNNSVKGTYKYKLDPSDRQKFLLNKTLNASRSIYNRALKQRIDAYNLTKKNIFFPEQDRLFRTIRREEFPFINAAAVSTILFRLEYAFKNFFKSIRTKNIGYIPKFGTKDNYASFRNRYRNGIRIRTIDGGQYLYLQYVGNIKIVCDQDLPEEDSIKYIVTHNLFDLWYIVVQCK